MEDLSVTAIDIGALANGISDPLSMDDAQLEQVKAFLIDHRDQFRTFWKGEADIKSQFKNGEVVIASGYPGTAKALRDQGVNVRFAAAKEGQMLWTCGYGISPEAENIDAAYALLNWYTSLPPQIYAATEFSYVTSNMNIANEVPQEVLDATGISGFVTGGSSDSGELNLIPASPPEDRSAWVAAWTEVKAA
jgi:spermidine/putrescine transport system substrate-binding protein